MAFLNNAAKAAGATTERGTRWYIDRTFGQSHNHRVLNDILPSNALTDEWLQIGNLIFWRPGYPLREPAI